MERERKESGDYSGGRYFAVDVAGKWMLQGIEEFARLVALRCGRRESLGYNNGDFLPFLSKRVSQKANATGATKFFAIAA